MPLNMETKTIYVKCKQTRLRFELWSTRPFPTMITDTPWASPKLNYSLIGQKAPSFYDEVYLPLWSTIYSFHPFFGTIVYSCNKYIQLKTPKMNAWLF